MGVLNNNNFQGQINPQARGISAVSGDFQKSSSSKAAVIFARRAYFQYVSTEKWRERRWRIFSTVPQLQFGSEGSHACLVKDRGLPRTDSFFFCLSIEPRRMAGFII